MVDSLVRHPKRPGPISMSWLPTTRHGKWLAQLSQRGPRVSTFYTMWGDDDVRTQLAKLTRQLKILTTKKVHEESTKVVEPCCFCEGVEHSTHD